jgi:hydrogenase expression/formation protein HypE
MKIGKLDNAVLEKTVLGSIKKIRTDVLVGPGIGEDCAALDFGEEACVLTTDPITGAGIHQGRLAVHVCLNDIASSGAEPVGLLLTILAPPDATVQEIQNIQAEAAKTAEEMGVEIIGGHTEITDAVTRMVVSATAVGRVPKKRLLKTGGALPGDGLFLTKSAGLEGSLILSSDRKDHLKAVLDAEDWAELEAMAQAVSVVPDGRIASGCSVHAMHDVTEGGVLGAIYEMCDAGNCGCDIVRSAIPIQKSTEKICGHFKIDPLKLISSGAMLIAAAPENEAELMTAFREADIAISKIGVLTKRKERRLYEGAIGSDAFEPIHAPEVDMIYQALAGSAGPAENASKE